MTLEILSTSLLVPSASIHIANQKDLKSITKESFGGSLPASLSNIDNSRFRGNYLSRDAVWGLKETSSDINQSLSTAIVMTGSELVFYIEPVGHGVGYLRCAPDKTVFTRTILTIQIYDLLRNSLESVEFRRFEDPALSQSRYIKWVVPEADIDSEALFSSDGIHGLYLMKIIEKSDFYTNSELSDELTLPDGITPPQNESTIQFRAYNWKKIISDVNSIGNYRNTVFTDNAYILTTPIDLNAGQSASEVFDYNTYFPSFQPSTSSGTSPLTEDQKGSVVLDSSMVLLSSQIPVLPSDSRLSGILALGMTEGYSSEIIPEQTAVRTKSIDRIPSPTPQRTFSLTGVPVCYNTYSDLKNLTNNRDQSGSTLFDPPIHVNFNEDGEVGDFDNNGLGMSIHGLEVTGTSFLQSHLKDDFSQISFGEDNLIRAEEILITVYSSLISVGITFTSGEERIKSISFKMAINDHNYVYYIDHTGENRSHNFSLDSTLHLSDIINVEIGVEDIDGNMIFFNGDKHVSIDFSQPSLSELSATQRKDGSGIVDITYDYEGSCELQTISVILFISRDGGETWNVPTESAAGDIGDGVISGYKRRILWNPYKDIPNESGNSYVAKISVIGEGRTVGGDGISGGFVVSTGTKEAIITIDPHKNSRYGAKSSISVKNPEMPFEEIGRSTTVPPWRYEVSSSSSSNSSSTSSYSSDSSRSQSSQSSSSSSSKSSSSSSSSISFLSSSSTSSTSSFDCPNNIISLVNTSIADDIVFTFDKYLNFNINDGVGNDSYIQLYSADTSGKTYDTEEVFWGSTDSINNKVSNGYISLSINGGDYYIPKYTGDATSECCSSIHGDNHDGNGAFFTHYGYALIMVNQEELKYIPLYIRS